MKASSHYSIEGCGTSLWGITCLEMFRSTDTKVNVRMVVKHSRHPHRLEGSATSADSGKIIPGDQSY